MAYSPADIAVKVGVIRQRRSAENPFDVAISGCSEPGQDDLPASYAQAGATWWLETVFGMRGSVEEMLRRVEAGPPRP